MQTFYLKLLLSRKAVMISALVSIAFLRVAKGEQGEQVRIPAAVQKALSAAGVLTSLRIESETIVSTWDDVKAQWLDSPVPTRLTILTEPHLARFRIDYLPLVLPWRGGPANFHESTVTYAYNGKFALKVLKTSGPAGAASPAKQAVVGAVPSDITKDALRYSGQELLLPTASLFKAMYLGDIVNNGLQGAKFAASLPAKDGIQEVTITVPRFPNLIERVWIRESDGGLVKRLFASVGPNGNEDGFSELYETLEWQSAELRETPFPKHFRVTTRNAGKYISKEETVIKSFVVNSPIDAESIFPAIAKGTFVEDTRLGVSFTVGEKPDEILENLGKTAKPGIPSQGQ